MRVKSFIKNLGGVFLLFVFGFSVMPKKTVHDIFARHHDSATRIHDSKTAQISWAGFHCNCDNLVVESPFIENHFPAAPAIIPSYSHQFSVPAVTISVEHLFDHNLRGPPPVSC